MILMIVSMPMTTMTVSVKAILRDSFILFSVPYRSIYEMPLLGSISPHFNIMRVILHDPDTLNLSIISYVFRIITSKKFGHQSHPVWARILT
jgi:hypothetical protein